MSDAAANPTPCFGVKTLGCKVNQVESEDFVEDLCAAGVRIVDEAEASVIIVNSCVVTGEAEAKTRKAIRHATSLPHEPTVVVTGCAATTAARTMSQLHARVVVESDKSQVVKRVLGLLGVQRGEKAGFHASVSQGRSRRYLKVEDGCDSFCTYCIIPHARGVPSSVGPNEIRRHAERLVAQGVSEIVLTGINIGRYDDEGRTLADVVEMVASTGVPRIRLSSIEPMDLNQRLLATMAATPAFCPHLHVPLQSGSDAVLDRMGRGYTAEQYVERITAARSTLPSLAVTADVMTGFPGETDENAAQTREVCERVGFSKLHVFRFSRRNGTPAAGMPDQVDPLVSAVRAGQLRELGEKLAMRYAHSRVGGDADLLVETVSDGWGRGTTEDYLKARAPVKGCEAGDIVRVRVLESRGCELVAGPL